MRPPGATLALLLLAAAAAGAAEQGGAPLESSKQALKALQADEKAKQGAAATGAFTDGLPQVQTPTPDTAPLDFLSLQNADKSDRAAKKKKEERRNWLLDGVDKLGRENPRDKGRLAGGDKGAAPTDGDREEKPDSSDPDYLLNLYTAQKREADTKAEARQASQVRSNPIAPFLQEWMGNSPVRGKFFDEFVRKPDEGAVPGSFSAPPNTGGNPNTGNGPVTDSNQRPAPDATPRPNPYLAGLEMPELPGAGTDGNAPSAGAALTLGAPSSSPPVTPLDPLPAARSAEKKPLLPAPADNDKYFPQLKKF